MAYAKRLTKERLIQEGFTEITKEGRLFKGEREVFPFWNGKEGNPNKYLCVQLCKRDEQGHLVKGKERVCKRKRKDGTIREYTSWTAITEFVGLHRAMWAWHYGEVPEGMVVDHINNQHSRIEDYHLDKLQLLTPKENVSKEKDTWHNSLRKCMMNKPRKFYEDKLAKYEALHLEAKANHDAKAAHKYRSSIAQTRARLRYWDVHENEYNKYKEYMEGEAIMAKELTKDKKDLGILIEYKKVFKEAGNKYMWHQCCKVERLWKAGELNQQAKDHVIDVLLKMRG